MPGTRRYEKPSLVGRLGFRPVMTPYCGKRYRVLQYVKKIIDARTRRLISLGGSAVILDGVVCNGRMRRFCPRMVYPYWRDIWLTKIESGATAKTSLAPGRWDSTSMREEAVSLATDSERDGESCGV